MAADQLVGRIDPELVGQGRSCASERIQRLALSPVSIQSEHQVAPQVLPQRMLRHEPLELADGAYVLADGEQPLDALLEGCEMELIETGRLGDERWMIRDVCKGRSAP